EEGVQQASATVAYPSRFFNGSWAEQDPEDWWMAVCGSTRELLALSGVAPGDIAVVALSGQMMGCTPVDAQGNALRPSILYCDQRATAQEAALLEKISMREFYGICGHRASASYTLEKLMWVRDNEPDIFAKTRKTLCAKDYINCRLTGMMATDFSDASGTNAFDLNTFGWSEKLIGLAGLDVSLFPKAVDSATIIGGVTAAAAQETGLAAGTPVAAGGGDGSAAGVGVGCVRPGTAYNCLGSSSWIALTVERPIVDGQMRTMNWAHCVPGVLHPSGTMQTAGSSFKWMAEQLCSNLSSNSANETNKDTCEHSRHPLTMKEIDDIIAKVPCGANGVMFLPYMLGERTPWWNPDARGAFIGLNLASTREDMLRAVMEGVAISLGTIADIFRGHVPIDRLTIIGGGAQSAVFRQVLADACACPVQTITSKADATSMGAAIIGGVACGLFKDFNVVDQLMAVDETTPPDAQRVAQYQVRRALMERAYLGLVEVYAGLARGKGKF
ncbi:MAG: FGGY-family carbohydrate kinase, partial [Kiritimatiellaeota bacterium]|nr:FGGY-family carbohydrate kinase [Kiritimatiellota bacterium]